MVDLTRSKVPVLVALFLSAALGRGEVKVSPVIGDNGVLQRDVRVPVWGRAEPGDEIAVAFAGQRKTATADRFGRWRVELEPMPASVEGRPMVVTGPDNTIRINTMYVGDVWLYLSQSWHLGGPEELRVDSGTLPPICINAPAGVWENRNHSRRARAGFDDGGRWSVYKEPGRYFRNDGYYVGLGVARVTGAPVGVMGLGASTLESMTPPEGFQAFEDELGRLAATVASWVPRTRRGKQAYLRSLGEIERWVRKTSATLERSEITYKDFTQPPQLPGPTLYERGPTTHYNFVTHRFTPAAVRGIIIQPKTFSAGDPQYLVKARALIHGLRAVFGRDDLPVCFVQMHSPGRYELREAEDPDDWVRMRDAQNRLGAIPHVTVVATYDLKAAGRSEPDIGLRAAQWAVAVVKGDAAKTGPVYKSHRIDGRRIIVEFDNTGEGLMIGTSEAGKPVQPAPDTALGGFQIAGADGEWHDAKAVIQNDNVIASANEVTNPVAVRYAWSPEPTTANLYNRKGFPALPFAKP